MTTYPLLFGFRDLVAGNGYFAEISLDGRAILVEENDGSFWMYGVNPGAIAAGGNTAGAAQAEFRLRYRAVLFDFAEEAGSFDIFQALVTDFFRQTCDEHLQQWTDAVAKVRAGTLNASWLPRSNADRRYHVKVTLSEPSPKANELDETEKLAA